jgi:hypothetical protein
MAQKDKAAGYAIKNTTPAGFLTVAGLFLGIMGIAFILPFAAPSLFKNPSTGQFGAAFFIMIAAACFIVMTVPFYAGIKMMRVEAVPAQRFTGKKETVRKLKGMNSDKYPLEIHETQKYDLVMEYKLADATWRGVLFRGGLDKAYKLYLKLDEKTKTAYCTETTKPIGWSANFDAVSASISTDYEVFQGIILLDSQKLMIRDPLQAFKKVADVKYDVREAKWPVFRMLLDNGWTVRPRPFLFQVRKDKTK